MYNKINYYDNKDPEKNRLFKTKMVKSKTNMFRERKFNSLVLRCCVVVNNLNKEVVLQKDYVISQSQNNDLPNQLLCDWYKHTWRILTTVRQRTK